MEATTVTNTLSSVLVSSCTLICETRIFVFMAMRSTNGIFKWMPANCTLLNLPNRSMMYACCCGTMNSAAPSTATMMTSTTISVIHAPTATSNMMTPSIIDTAPLAASCGTILPIAAFPHVMRHRRPDELPVSVRRRSGHAQDDGSTTVMPMRIRHATLDDATAIASVEAACFPAAEAASEREVRARLAVYPNHFWLMGMADSSRSSTGS